MAKIRILIIEDEAEQSTELKECLEDLDYEVTGIADNIKDAYGLYYSQNPDLVVSDIYLNGQPDGIVFAKKVMENGISLKPFIFLTAHADRSTFEMARIAQPLNYLIKPFTYIELQYAIELAIEKTMNAPGYLSMGQPVMHNNDLFVKKGNSLVKLVVEDIFYIEVSGKFCSIVAEKESYLLQQSLNQLMNSLVSTWFIRIHRNYIVNFKNIKKLLLDESELVLANGATLPFSSSYKKELLEKLNVIK